MIKRFLSYYRPHRRLFILDMLASVGVALLVLAYPVLTRRMLNQYIPNRNLTMVALAGLLLLGLYGVKLGLNYFIQYQGHMMGVAMQAQMRSELFAHLQKLPFSFFDSLETGRIMSRLTDDLMEISELAHHGPEMVITCFLSLVLSFTYLASLHVWLTLILFLCVPILLLIANRLQGRMRKAFRESRVAVSSINAAVQSSVAGIRITKAFTNTKKEQEKFESGNEEFREARRDAYRAMAGFHSTTTFITDVFNVAVLIAGGVFLYRGSITFADYSAFIVSINLFLAPVNNMIRFMEQFQNGISGFERFTEIMDMEPEQDNPDALELQQLQGEICFAAVTSTYGEEGDILQKVSMTIPQGSTFALVGPSGGGKTTICHLIPRFYEVKEGAILLDGQDIRSFTRESLRRSIGIVQQDMYLFNASIRDNIRYGKEDATEEEIHEAARRANIYDYIQSLEKGYDTIVGERGVRLSGGQKQRLCIARVFLKNPPILILDEATSALDNTTEILIQQALDELCKGRTTIVVAHRLSTIKKADQIAVIADGQIVEQGTHKELLSRNGKYAELYRLQFRGSGE